MKSRLGFAPKYLRDLIRTAYCAASPRPLRSLDRHDIFVPRTKTTLAQTRSFATIGPALCNAIPSSLRVFILSGCSYISLAPQNLFLLSGYLLALGYSATE